MNRLLLWLKTNPLTVTVTELEIEKKILIDRLRVAEVTASNALAKLEGYRELASERFIRIEDLHKQVDWYAKRLGGRKVYGEEEIIVEDPNQPKASYVPVPMDNASQVRMLKSKFMEEYIAREGI